MSFSNLARLRATGSTGRVLNLAQVHARFGSTPEYSSAPLFLTSALNKALIIKHTLRGHERNLASGNRLNATKVVLPFVQDELALGGYAFFVNEPGFERNLAHRIGIQPGSDPLLRDIRVLQTLDSLPAFDPFLLRERLKRDSIPVARCYFDLSEGDAVRMKTYLESEIGKIVQLAFAANADLASLSATMTEKLMTDETSATLEPLRHALGMSGEAYRDGVFAWKGFLYYSWNLTQTLGFVPVLQRQMLAMRMLRATAGDLAQINATRRRLVRCLAFLTDQVRRGVEEYRIAYQRLVMGDPVAFRRFLSEAPQHFLEVGDALGMLLHMKSFWEYRFASERQLEWVDLDEANEIFRDFSLQMSGIAAIAGDADLMQELGIPAPVAPPEMPAEAQRHGT